LRPAIRSSTVRPREDRRDSRVAAGVWALIILAATSVPAPDIRAELPHWADKVVHFTLYFVLGVLVARAFLPPAPVPAAAIADGRIGKRRHTGWLVLALLAIFAGADELHQHWIRGRMPSSADWIADVLGAGIGIAIGTHIRRSKPRPDTGIDRETNR